jgi:hypothetical protein
MPVKRDNDIEDLLTKLFRQRPCQHPQCAQIRALRKPEVGKNCEMASRLAGRQGPIVDFAEPAVKLAFKKPSFRDCAAIALVA